MYKTNNIGPRTDSCGPPLVRFAHSDAVPLPLVSVPTDKESLDPIQGGPTDVIWLQLHDQSLMRNFVKGLHEVEVHRIDGVAL